jgi:hypothetical protein
MKGAKKNTKRPKIRDLEKPPGKQDEERIKGGMTPAPGGPVPIPYPNTSKS